MSVVKLNQKQADALRLLSTFPEAGFPLLRYATATALVRRGLAEFARNTYFPRRGRPWELSTHRDWSIRITAAGQRLLTEWKGTRTWLTMTR